MFGLVCSSVDLLYEATTSAFWRSSSADSSLVGFGFRLNPDPRRLFCCEDPIRVDEFEERLPSRLHFVERLLVRFAVIALLDHLRDVDNSDLLGGPLKAPRHRNRDKRGCNYPAELQKTELAFFHFYFLAFIASKACLVRSFAEYGATSCTKTIENPWFLATC